MGVKRSISSELVSGSLDSGQEKKVPDLQRGGGEVACSVSKHGFAVAVQQDGD